LNGLRDRQIAEDPSRERFLPALEAEVNRLTRLARQPEQGEEYVETVFRLNHLLTQASRNSRLRSILGSLAVQTRRYSQLGLLTPQRRRQSAQNWQQFLKAIRDGDGAQAERIARERVLESRDAAIRTLQEHDEAGAMPERKARRAA
jgi:DNA-binding FadR family transcriptional regulator